MNVSERLHYMDNLRALTMIAGVFFHAALAYSPFLQTVWLSSDSVTSSAVDWFANFTHIFRMPLFFIIAGFFAALLVERRGSSRFFNNRVMRIFLPFIVFWPVITAAIILPLGWALNHVENLSPLFSVVAPGKSQLYAAEFSVAGTSDHDFMFDIHCRVYVCSLPGFGEEMPRRA